jgi:CRP-like cAMP-binding protein
MNSNKKEVALNVLLDYFDRVIKLSSIEKELVTSKFSWRQYRKHQYLLQEGDICQHFNFVIDGCLRIYKTNENGGIHILQFAIENWWINDINSFHKKKPTILNIDALEDTEVLQISYSDMIDLYIKAPKFDRIFRVLVENAYCGLQERLLLTISSSADELYSYFLETYPFLLNRLSQIQIAAYLGVTPEFLSRVKNRSPKPSRPKS